MHPTGVSQSGFDDVEPEYTGVMGMLTDTDPDCVIVSVREATTIGRRLLQSGALALTNTIYNESPAVSGTEGQGRDASLLCTLRAAFPRRPAPPPTARGLVTVLVLASRQPPPLAHVAQP
jgi:hypothetical protein